MDDLERIAWQFWDQYIRNEKEILKNQPLPSNRGKKQKKINWLSKSKEVVHVIFNSKWSNH